MTSAESYWKLHKQRRLNVLSMNELMNFLKYVAITYSNRILSFKKDSKSTGGRWYTSISIAVQIQEMVGQDKSLQESDRIQQE